jgi:hypothetical protein
MAALGQHSAAMLDLPTSDVLPRLPSLVGEIARPLPTIVVRDTSVTHPPPVASEFQRFGAGTMTEMDSPVTPRDGCGRCLVGVIRLSRMTDKTSSPQKQVNHILAAAAAAGAHIIAWAIDLEVSGAMDPLTRPGLGPWLRGEAGHYDGIAAYDVARVGRNVRDCLNTQQLLTDQGRVVVTADHHGAWDFTDQNQENE